MKFVKMNRQNLADMDKANQPFEIIGKLKPAFAGGTWTCTEELFERSYEKAYPNDARDYGAYINDPGKAVFLAYSGDECAGQIVLKRDWNSYALIEDICVAKPARGQGIGAGLLQKAIEWAQNSELKGLAAETQDNNLPACRFYAKHGFVIGGVNTMLYRNFDTDEFAVFWYLAF